MRRIVLAAALAVLAGCDRTPEPPPPAVKPIPPLPPLPEIKPSEDFVKDGFLELPPGDAAAFRWNLDENAAHKYTYEQVSHLVMTVTGGTDSTKLTRRTEWKGDAKVVGGGGGRGELVFVGAPIAQWNNNQPLPSEDLNKIPKTVAQYMLREDGTVPARQVRSGQEDPKLDLFFALPSKELKAGESDRREVHLAYVSEDFKYHGKQEMTHAGRRKIGRHECVKLLSKLDLEAVPPGDGNGRLIGWVAAYFDPKERTFARVDAALVIAVDMRNEVRPADPKVEPYWLLNRLQADMRVTMLRVD